MNTTYTLEELAEAVRAWCEAHRVLPANGQAAEAITERTIRYYRTLGLLDAPQGGYVKSFTDKHRLQLIAIRIYQALGLPLRRIRDELYGKSLEDLQQLEALGAKGSQSLPRSFAPPPAIENWTVIPLSDDFLLVSRQSRTVPSGVIQKLRRALKDAAGSPLTHNPRN